MEWLGFHGWRLHAGAGLTGGVGPALAGSYNIGLVLLSLVVAVAAALAALAVVDRIAAARGVPFQRAVWVAAGATAMGSGIWAMHFIGMLAFVLPVPAEYAVWTTLASMLPAMAGSGITLLILSRQRVDWRHLHLGGLLLAAAIGSMHYLGMEAMQVAAVMTYDPTLFVLSIAVAYVLATAALYARVFLKRHARRPGLALSSVVLGGATAAMHYTAMAAVRFHAGHMSGAHGVAVPPVMLSTLIGLFVAFILGLTLVSTAVHRQLTATRTSLAESAVRHTTVLETMADGLVTFDDRGWIESANAACERLFHHPGAALLAMSVEDILPGCLDLLRSSPSHAGRQATHQVDGRRRDGSVVPTEITFGRMAMPDRTLFSAVVRDVTERRRADEAVQTRVRQAEEAREQLAQQTEALRRQAVELTRARDRAEAAARSKAEFLATVSHEIRTPMNGVLGMAQLLLDSGLPSEQRELAKTVHSSGLALLAVINDILDFSKVDAGKLAIEPIPFDLHAAIGEVLDLLAANADNKSVELALEIAEDTPRHVVGDPGRIRQILLNLVSNAIKFTSDGHVLVEVGGRATEGAVHVRFAVTDTGIGTTPEQKARLFQPFSQGDASTTRRFGGTGLGLAISKRLVDLMGGAIGVEDAPGRGSRFWFSLTLPEAEGPAAAPTPDVSGVRVLVVDDTAVNLKILQKQLAAWGMRPECVTGAVEATRALRAAREEADPFGLAIVDALMPDVDGFELARRIRADAGIAGTRLLMLTSAGVRGEADKSRESGFDAFLTKPARPDTLRRVVGMLIHGEGRAQAMVTPLVPVAAAVDTASAAAPDGALGLRVLVAEDNTVNQKVAHHMLKRLGCRVDLAANGVEAVDLWSRFPYDVILMDCQMPELNGYDATRAIRDREAVDGRHVPIIALTAGAMEGDRQACLDAGMDDYLSKPISAERLRAFLTPLAVPSPVA